MKLLDELEEINDLLCDGFAGKAVVKLGKLLDRMEEEEELQKILLGKEKTSCVCGLPVKCADHPPVKAS